MSAKKNDKKNNKKPHKKLKIFLLTLLTLVIIATAVLSGIVLAVVKTAPDVDTNKILDLKETSVLYDDKGNPIDELILTDDNGQIIKRTVVDLKDTSPYLGKAFVAIEDERFYTHNGIDLKGITRASLTVVRNKLFRKNTAIQGGSTITQQLIKNKIFLKDSINNRLDYKRKIQEAYMAIELEKNLSKDEILEAYMNTIYLGGTSHGVEAASNQYFSKASKDLTLVESAFIAGIAQSPTYFYPFSDSCVKNPSIYLNKTKLVLAKMQETNSITKEEYDQAIKEIESKGNIEFKRSSNSNNKYTYEWFSRPVVDQIKKDLMDQYNYDSTQVTAVLINGGLKIYTTMDKDLQDKTQNILNTDATFTKAKNKSKDLLQASAVVMDYHSGEVKVIVGGRDEKNQPAGGYNRAADVEKFHRSTGSTIKPLTVYAPAIDTKAATPSSIVEDTELTPALMAKYNYTISPKDDDGKTMGNITLREALARSRNLVAIRLEDKIGLNTGFAYAEKFGIKLQPSEKLMSTLSLGQFTYGTNTLAMASAYGVFGNSGMYAYPRLYTKVVDKTGKTILETKYTTKKAIEPQTAYIMWDLLKGPVSSIGTGPGAKREVGEMPVAGKTGTATSNKDLWFCGLTPYYSAAVWIGNDDASVFSGIYSSDAATVWGRIMKQANAKLPIKDLSAPSGLVTVSICKDSGKLSTELCSKDSVNGNRVYTDVFLPGAAPTAVCDEHIELKVNKTNNKIATESTPENLIELRVYHKSTAPTEQDNYTAEHAEANSDNTIRIPIPNINLPDININ